MNIISHEDAIEIVRKKGISYIADLDNISYLIQENELQIDRVRFGIAGDLILYKDDIVIQIGKENHLEEKMMNLPGILEKAEGMKGTLHMEEFGSDSKIVTFIPEKVKKSSKKQNKNSAQT